MKVLLVLFCVFLFDCFADSKIATKSDVIKNLIDDDFVFEQTIFKTNFAFADVTVSDVVLSGLNVSKIVNYTTSEVKDIDVTRKDVENIDKILQDIGYENDEGQGGQVLLDDIDENEKIKQSKIVITLDAGHGGHDTGAIGSIGTLEKNVTLRYVKDLTRALEKIGFIVKMTRDDDVFYSLIKRRNIANENKSDFFVSIHADSAPNEHAVGMSVYTISESASDRTAEVLAKFHDEDYHTNGVEDVDAKVILLHFEQKRNMVLAKNFASILLKNMEDSNMPIISPTPKAAGFAVLKRPEFPSVLIEIGFLSNEQEELLLNTPFYRERVVVNIAKSLERFFIEH